MALLLSLAQLAATTCTDRITILGAGSSFPGQLYRYASTGYELQRKQLDRDVQISYQSVNSGYGKARIVAQDEPPPIVFAGTESLLGQTVKADHPDLVTIPVMAG